MPMKTPLRIALSYISSPSSIPRTFSWRFRPGISLEPIVFVFGAPRSGTTLLQRVLALNDQLFSIDAETGLFSLQNIFTRKHFGLSWNECQNLFQKSCDVVNFLENGVSEIRKKNGFASNMRMVEKTPQHVMHLGFLMRHFPRARFIHIVRDGRDCFCSSRNHPNIPQNSSVRRFAKYWAACVTEGLKFDTRNNLIRVKYEDLVASPESVVGDLMHRLDLNLQRRQLDPGEIGQDDRAKRDEFARLRHPIRPASVGRWRLEMDERELKNFEDVAGHLMPRLGYATDNTQRQLIHDAA